MHSNPQPNRPHFTKFLGVSDSFIEISFFRDVVSISNFEVTIPLLFEKNMNEV